MNNTKEIKPEKKEIAISVKNLSKRFQVPHQKIDSVRSAFVNLFAKKTYEEFHALDDVSFDIHKGEFVGIIGHNGSGKSTLLKSLAGVYTPSSGNITVNGKISPFLELGIGFNPELSGRDNIYLNATILGLTKKQIDEKFQQIVDFSEIGEFIDQQVKNYSSGMQGRLAFSVSIHANRDILLMDEVLAVGDTRFQAKCMREFKKYKDQKKTVVLVTHDVNVVREYCDRSILLHRGKMIMSGDVDKVCDEYILKNMTEDQKQELKKRKEQERKEKKRQREIEIQQEKEAEEARKMQELELKKLVLEKAKKEKKEQEKERSKKAKVIDVVCISDAAAECQTFGRQGVIKVNVAYKILNDIERPNFGIGITNRNGVNIFASNTRLNNIEMDKVVSGSTINVVFIIDNCFADGEYFISAAIVDKNDQEIDWKDGAAEFKITNKWNTGSVVDFRHSISIEN